MLCLTTKNWGSPTLNTNKAKTIKRELNLLPTTKNGYPLFLFTLTQKIEALKLIITRSFPIFQHPFPLYVIFPLGQNALLFMYHTLLQQSSTATRNLDKVGHGGRK